MRLREPGKGRTKKGRKKFAANWREPRLFIVYAVDENGRMTDDVAPILGATLRITLETCRRRWEIMAIDCVRSEPDVVGAAWVSHSS